MNPRFINSSKIIVYLKWIDFFTMKTDHFPNVNVNISNNILETSAVTSDNQDSQELHKIPYTIVEERHESCGTILVQDKVKLKRSQLREGSRLMSSKLLSVYGDFLASV